MSGPDHFRKVTAGEQLRIPASTYNAMVDAAIAHRNRSHDLFRGGTAARGAGAGVVIRIRNDSGGAVAQGGVLGIDGLAVDAGMAQRATRSIFAGVTPAAAHRGRFGVLTRALGAGAAGEAAVLHLVNVSLQVPAGGESCRYADVGAGTAGLLAASFGAAEILWKEAPGPGVVRAIVSLGPHPAVFPVALSQTGGAQGTNVAVASWTYSIQDPATGQVLATGINPTAAPHRHRRPTAGFLLAATHGLATLAADGSVALAWINEVADQESC